MTYTTTPKSSMTAVLPSSTPEGVHRRLNILTGKHILVSPHRSKRPWNGQVESNKKVQEPAHDPACYLCPGNQRVGGDKNPDYKKQYIFGNDFPALVAPPATSETLPNVDSNEPQEVYGCCKVLCYHPRHDITMAGMSETELGEVITAWKEVYMLTSGELKTMEPAEGPSESHVMIFENRGAAMGASAPHPHGQVWGTSFIPDEVETEYELYARHRSKSTENRHLLLQYAQEELRDGSRVVAEDAAGWMAVVPFWATWPFEVLVLPTDAQIPSLVDLTASQADGLAKILKQVLGMYDSLFDCPFPYSMGIHQAPSAHGPKHDAQLHIHFYPPLLRSATVRKFMVGFELLAEAQRDLTPEQAAARLRQARPVDASRTNGVH